MKNFLSRRDWVRPIILGGALLWAGLAVTASGQTNSWTNSASGNWEDPGWSLGILPGPGQTILLTNSGWKAVSIGTNTVQNFPQTLAVDAINISSPIGSFNTLALNYATLKHPLSVNSLAVASNSAVVMNGSSLQVSNSITVNGTFTEDTFSVVTNRLLDVETIGSGGYNLNSGLLISVAGEDIGRDFPSTFTQAGGTNLAFALRIYTNSEYDLNGGSLTGTIIVRPEATFKQSGGVVDNSGSMDDLVSIDGKFLQSGGAFIGATNNAMYLPAYVLLHQGTASGSALQTGGTNQQNNLIVGLQIAPENQDNGKAPAYGGSYTLSNGVLVTSGTIIGANGRLEQAGGTHTVNGTLQVQGALYYSNGIVSGYNFAAYGLDGGTLSVGDLSIGVAATFSQTAGTNHVVGDVTLTRSINPIGYFNHARYHLYNGQLTASNILVAGGELTQAGGQLIISNGLQLADTTFQQSGGEMIQYGRLTLADASWFPASGNQQLGRLQLGVSDNTSSILSLPGDACVLHLGDSSSLVWSNRAVLNIFNWAGSVYGGGNQRIIFGNSAAALTGQQLGQITFANPASLAVGNYPARILATGEIVPDTGAALPVRMGAASGSNGTLQITIGGQIGSNYVIQTSTDLLHWAPWTTQFNSTGTISVDDRPTNGLARFYRAVALP